VVTLARDKHIFMTIINNVIDTISHSSLSSSLQWSGLLVVTIVIHKTTSPIVDLVLTALCHYLILEHSPVYT
jgi:hypothetical protein